MHEITTKCDICGTVKRKTNHWFVVSVSDDKQSCSIIPYGDIIIAKYEFNWNYDVCGLPCAFKKISEKFGERA